MNKKQEKNPKKGQAIKARFFSLEKRNYQMFGLALICIVAGYFLLAQPPVQGFTTLTLAPMVLLVGYCVLVPLAIFWKPKAKKSQ